MNFILMKIKKVPFIPKALHLKKEAQANSEIITHKISI